MVGVSSRSETVLTWSRLLRWTRSVDYGVHGTRVLSNPRGYMVLVQGMENQAFQADRVVEL